jgi:hypothetical protein
VYSCGGEGLDGWEGAGEFGSECDKLDGGGMEVGGAVAGCEVGNAILRFAKDGRIVDAVLGRVQEWTFTVGAERL